MATTEVPYNLEAEAAVLGSLLIDPDAHRRVVSWLLPEHFYIQKHAWIYKAVMAIIGRGDALDFVTITTEMNKRGQLDAIGGSIYLSQLISSVPSAINIDSYARIVEDAHRRRQMLDLVSDVAKLAYQEDNNIYSAADYVKARLAELFATQGSQKPQAFSEVAATLPEIRWLWPAWVPLKMLTLMGAVAGAGKSMVALDLAKRVIHGMPFPNGAVNPCPEGRNVIYIDGEFVPQLIKERSEQWRIDTSKLFVMLPRPNDLIDFGRHEYQEQLRSMVAQTNPGLIVIDSLSSITTKGENSIEDVRAILGFLNDVASSSDSAMIIIHHLRKRSGAQLALPFDLSIDDFRGSTHITAMARSVLGLSVVQVGPDSDPNGPRKLSVLKSNLCRIPEAIGCEFLPLHPKGVLIEWDAKAPEPYRAPTKLEQCMEFIEAVMKDTEPISPKEMVDLARDEGYNRNLVFQARKALGSHVQNTGGYKDPNNKWRWVG